MRLGELERGCLRVAEKRLDHRTDSDLGRARQRIEPAHDLFELGKPIAVAINGRELVSRSDHDSPQSEMFRLLLSSGNPSI